jgi:hypothetical protein
VVSFGKKPEHCTTLPAGIPKIISALTYSGLTILSLF